MRTYTDGQLTVLEETLDGLIRDYQEYQSEDIGRSLLSKLRIYADRDLLVRSAITNKNNFF